MAAHFHPAHDLVSVRIAAELCGVSHTTIRFWAREQWIESWKPDGRPLQITVASLSRVLGSRIRVMDVIEAARSVREGHIQARVDARARFPRHDGKPPVFTYVKATFNPDHITSMETSR